MLLKQLKEKESNKRIAVVLLNLGGPDTLDAVQPFLFNLFNDKAIIRLPQPFRYLLARWISKTRAPKARKIYSHLGGKSPLLENTQAQKQELAQTLQTLDAQVDWRVFIAMRYWHPLTEDVVQDVKNFDPDEIVLLPLYPQFSTTTSESSFSEWQKQSSKFGLSCLTHTIGCYPLMSGFIKSMQKLLEEALKQAPATTRVLFSAHGLPQKVVDDGDPYAHQVDLSVEEVMKAFPQVDYRVCYQSKVGKLKWLEPSLDEEMERAAESQVGVVIVPISFVSEHSETLVELDIDFAQRAKELHLPFFARTPTVSCHPLFITGLAELVIRKIQPTQGQGPVCPPSSSKCWCRAHG